MVKTVKKEKTETVDVSSMIDELATKICMHLNTFGIILNMIKQWV